MAALGELPALKFAALGHNSISQVRQRRKLLTTARVRLMPCCSLIVRPLRLALLHCFCIPTRRCCQQTLCVPSRCIILPALPTHAPTLPTNLSHPLARCRRRSRAWRSWLTSWCWTLATTASTNSYRHSCPSRCASSRCAGGAAASCCVCIFL